MLSVQSEIISLFYLAVVFYFTCFLYIAALYGCEIETTYDIIFIFTL